MPSKPYLSALSAPSDVYPIKALRQALKSSGDYVYAYYGRKSNPEAPFYVGKGKGTRVLDHWQNAISSTADKSLKDQEMEIRSILRSGQLPVVKLLAYNVETTPRDKVYSLVERVIQDAFGIQKVWEKHPGMDDREVPLAVSSLVQVREDSARTPVQSLDALIGWRGNRETVTKDELPVRAQGPVLLVGLMKTFHPSFSPRQLAEMARMYWDLAKYEGTSLGTLEDSKNAALLAWRKIDGRPTIVGAWRIQRGTFTLHRPSGRTAVGLQKPDLLLRREVIGLHLDGSGTKYMGPRILLANQ